jgi:hypothetical protein
MNHTKTGDELKRSEKYYILFLKSVQYTSKICIAAMWLDELMSAEHEQLGNVVRSSTQRKKEISDTKRESNTVERFDFI